MERGEVRSSRRGRKRRRGEIQNVRAEEQVGPVVRSTSFVGRYVKKEFEGNGLFLGMVVYYNSGLYRVVYEDGDCEDLDSGDIRTLLVEEDDLKGVLRIRKKKLDRKVAKNSFGLNTEPKNGVSEVSSLIEIGGCDDGSTVENESVHLDDTEDSYSDSCELVQDRESSLEAETLLPSPLQLPPSSGTIGVPDDYVSHLFSVYTFLRSFSIRLFLSPFSLNEFVGSLNSPIPNTLLDAVHAALLRALSHHLEKLPSDGSELASKCLRGIDWRLLDQLTWPVYMVHYLIVMGHTKRPEWKGVYTDLIDMEYYTLPSGTKLMILQILCDDVLDFAELRAEIDMREEEEVGIDPDVTTNSPLENLPRRVHPRNSKTSACKDQEVMNIIRESHEIKSSASKGDTKVDDVDMDANSDECRVCGMDGTLLCCDGCPSAYHSRCIGVSKTSIPEGSWFCPECNINMISPPVTMETSLRAAEIFGTDPFGQLFLGTCSHLLVLNASFDAEPCLRYYNQIDIPKVLQAFHCSLEHATLYSGLCKRISQYWKIPESTFALPERLDSSIEVAFEKIDAICLTLSPHPSGMEIHDARQSVVEGNFDSSLTESNVEKVASTSNNTSTTMTQLPCLQQSGDTTTVKRHATGTCLPATDTCLPATGTCLPATGTCLPATGTCLPANIMSQSRDVYCKADGRNASEDCLYLGSPFSSFSYFNHYTHGEFAASAAANLAIISSEENPVIDAHALSNPRKLLTANILLQVKAFSSTANRFFWPYFEKKHGEVPRERCGWCLGCKSPPSNRKACLLNSAALNATRSAMKILSKHCPIKSGDGNLPKISTYILYMEESLRGLTAGPFLSANYRRNWHKQVKQASSVNELKSPLLELEENIRIIALSPDWVKLVDNWPFEASVAHNASSSVGQTQKSASGKPGRRSKKQLVDNCPVEASRAQNAPSSVGQTRKRGRPSKKQPAICEVIAISSDDTSDDFCWWRGNKQSIFLFQKATLPRSIVKKAAHLGGKWKIPGVDYSEDSNNPRRSRQLIWRAAVELSNDASQIALQVRYLDFHIKWSDLCRSEQNVQDGKEAETEASAFRNAIICDKKVTEKKAMYGVTFVNQKHLPSRVMKNIILTEQDQEGKDKLWFYETRIPLYLMKEYEEKAANVILPSAHEPSNSLSKLQRKQLKAARRDAFAYLLRRRDKWDQCSCASCQLDVILGSAVRCSVCQGYCHQSCTISSTVHSNVGVECMITCKQCHDVNSLSQKETCTGSPTTPLPLQGRVHQQAGPVSTGAKHTGQNRSLVTKGTGSDRKHATASSLAKKSKSKICSWGIIWRKKKGEDEEVEDNGTYFRLKNILKRGDPDLHGSKPLCHLCQNPYKPDLTYIRCGHCNHWYHGDAVELDYSKIPEVVGFKCCKCRRIRSPVCPYLDPNSNKLEVRRRPLMESKQGGAEISSVSRTIPRNNEGTGTVKPIFPKKEEPVSFSKGDTIMESNAELSSESGNISGMGLQKLPVRRQVKREDEDIEGFTGNNDPSHVELPIPTEKNGNMGHAKEASSPLIEWDVSANGFEHGTDFDNGGLDIEDMEFEPQTYFSFTELMASEDEGGEMDGNDASMDLMANLETMSPFTHEELFDPNEICADMDENLNAIACKICSHFEPAPDLFCQTCCLLIHNHCSPWVEDSSFGEDNWKCGNCREWQ